MTEDSVYPQEKDRRPRIITKGSLREECRTCGGPLELLVRGRDHRAVCLGCHKNPDQCGCLRRNKS